MATRSTNRPRTRACARAARTPRIRREDGFTLIELLVTSALLAVVLSAVLAMLEHTEKLAPKEIERGSALQEAQVGLDRMTRELRQGKPATGTLPATPTNSLDVIVGSQRVRYTCDVASQTPGLRRCVRYASSDLTTSPGGTGQTVLNRVSNGTLTDPVFYPATGGPSVNYFEAKLKVPAGGELKPGQGYGYTLTLDDGFYLRNAS